MKRDDAILVIETIFIDTQNTPKNRKEIMEEAKIYLVFYGNTLGVMGLYMLYSVTGPIVKKAGEHRHGKGGATVGQQAQRVTP